MRKTVFIKNAVILTVTGIILRFLGIIFKVWLAGAVGSEGIGLYHLIFSVYILAASFASAGIPTAVTRKVTDCLAIGSVEGARTVLRRCLSLSIWVSLFSFAAVFFGADYIAGTLLNDMRAAPALRILCFSLPFMAISCVFKGYFIARRNVTPNSVALILEQSVRILLCIVLVRRFLPMGLAYACGAVLAGDTAAEFVSLLYIGLRFRFDNRHLPENMRKADGTGTREIVRIALPITAGRYLTSVLRTAENMLVPRTLCQSGMAYADSLSSFGAIKGMALPVLFFPSSVLNAFSTLLIPELSEALTKNRSYIIKSTVKKALYTTWLVGVIFGAVFFFTGKQIGSLVYSDDTAGELICLLAPLVPFMYLDSIADGLLKGLDCQGFTFRTACLDSAVRIGLILPVVPRYGMNGFLAVMVASNLLTSGLHVGKLIRVASPQIKPLREIFAPLLTALAVCLSFRAALSFLGNGIVFSVVFILCTVAAYCAALAAFRLIDFRDYL